LGCWYAILDLAHMGVNPWVSVNGPGAVREGQQAMGMLSGGAGWRFGVNG
jgi:hypothetical protein